MTSMEVIDVDAVVDQNGSATIVDPEQPRAGVDAVEGIRAHGPAAADNSSNASTTSSSSDEEAEGEADPVNTSRARQPIALVATITPSTAMATNNSQRTRRTGTTSTPSRTANPLHLLRQHSASRMADRQRERLEQQRQREELMASQADFQMPRVQRSRAPRKRPRLANKGSDEEADGNDVDGTNKENQTAADESSDDDESMTCSICLEAWTTAGKHRIVNLRCGHVFGKSCIERWIKTSAGSSKVGKCPQCNAPAKVKDVRPIFVKKLRALDNLDEENLRANLDEERRRRVKAEEELSHVRLKWQMSLGECERAREKIKELKESARANALLPTSGNTSLAKTPIHAASTSMANFIQGNIQRKGGFTAFVYQRKVQVANQANGSRVCCFSRPNDTIICSRSQTSSSGSRSAGLSHGIFKINLCHPNMTQYVGLHEGPVRDVVCSPHREGHVLTGSFDRTLALSTMESGNLVMRYKLPFNAWSCCFHPTDRNLLFCGLGNSQVLMFDTRKTDTALGRLDVGVLGTTRSQSPLMAMYCLAASPDHSSTETSSTSSAYGLLTANFTGLKYIPLDLLTTPSPTPLAQQRCPTVDSHRLVLPTAEGTLAMPPACNVKGLAYDDTTRRYLLTLQAPTTAKTHFLLGHVLGSGGPEATKLALDTSFCNPTMQSKMSRSALYQDPWGTLFAATGSDKDSSVCLWKCRPQAQPHPHAIDLFQVLATNASPPSPVLDILPCHTTSRRHILALLNDQQLFLHNAQEAT